MIREKSKTRKPVIDLTGPEGNAFVLISHARRWATQLGIAADPIVADMMSGDYEHLLEVVEKHFGEYVVFER